MGGARRTLALDAREGPQGRNGSVTPPVLRQRGTITRHWGTLIVIDSFEDSVVRTVLRTLLGGLFSEDSFEDSVVRPLF